MSRVAARLAGVTQRRQPPKGLALWVGATYASALLGRLMNDLSWPTLYWVTGIGLGVGFLTLGLHRLLVWADRRYLAPRRKARARAVIRRQLGPTPYPRRFAVVKQKNPPTRTRVGQGIPGIPKDYPKAS
jgi:hypothetical protein